MKIVHYKKKKKELSGSKRCASHNYSQGKREIKTLKDSIINKQNVLGIWTVASYLGYHGLFLDFLSYSILQPEMGEGLDLRGVLFKRARGSMLQIRDAEDP